MRVNIYIEDNVCKRIDERAKTLGMTRSSFIVMSAVRQIESEELLLKVPELIEASSKILSASEASPKKLPASKK